LRVIHKVITHKLVLLGAAGALGTLARYGLCCLVERMAGKGFPWGTLAVNIGGCFIAGFIWVMATHKLAIGPETQAVILVGFSGAFTTFSAFVLETSEYLHGQQWAHAARNVMLQNFAGIAAFFAGLGCAKLL
jgi:CrcB protein